MEDFIRITVLSENTVGVPKGLVGECGLSMLLEKEGFKILFDTGEQGNLIKNATALGIDLKQVNALTLSHGHYDHTGGMQSFLNLRGKIPVYAHPDLFASHYGSPDAPRHIGVPFCREDLESRGADFIFTRESLEIIPGIWVSGEIPRHTDFEKGDSNLFYFENGNTVPDPLLDDMSLYCITPSGLLIILGCAHAGLVNIVEHARQVTAVRSVYGIIGGTHLGPASVTQKEATINYLKSLNMEFLAANHCTGLPMISRLAGTFGHRFHFAPAGSIFTLPNPAYIK